jgi:hypothetical protein
MYSNKKIYEGTAIYNRRDFTDVSQMPSVSGNNLNSNDFVLKTGDVKGWKERGTPL